MERYPATDLCLMTCLADGADQFAAEIAESLGIKLIVPLPMEQGIYRKTIQNTDRFDKLTAAADHVFISPSFEKKRPPDYEFAYRQSGIYIVKYSHMLLSFWDGSEDDSSECGTRFVTKLALDGGHADGTASPADRRAVFQIVAPRQKRPSIAKPNELIKLGDHEHLNTILRETDGFNAELNENREMDRYPLLPLSECSSLSSSASLIHETYQYADALSRVNRNQYYKTMRRLALSGVLMVTAFLLYDEIAWPWFLLLYAVSFFGSLLFLIGARKKRYHEKYLNYRAFAETLRVQFFLVTSGAPGNVGDFFTWSQNLELGWAKLAANAFLAGLERKDPLLSLEKINEFWVTGQAQYHEEAAKRTAKRITLNNLIAGFAVFCTILVFLSLTVFEVFFQNLLYLEFLGKDLRCFILIFLGLSSAAALFLSNYYGKLSFSRILDDHRKMALLYRAAEMELGKKGARASVIFSNLAKEEIVENGVWYSYCRDNKLDLNL